MRSPPSRSLARAPDAAGGGDAAAADAEAELPRLSEEQLSSMKQKVEELKQLLDLSEASARYLLRLPRRW